MNRSTKVGLQSPPIRSVRHRWTETRPGPDPDQQLIPSGVMEALKDRLAEPKGPEQLQGYPAVVGRDLRRRTLLSDGPRHRSLRVRGKAEGASALPFKKQQEQVEFQENLPSFLSGLEPGRPVRLFCQDECRIGLMPTRQIPNHPSRRGTDSDRQARIRSRKPSALYGAVEPETGQRFPAEHERLNSDCFQVFLDRFVEAFPRSHNVMILDNG